MRIVKEGTLNNMHLSGLPQFLWNFAMAHKVNTLNRNYSEGTLVNADSQYLVPHERKFKGDKPDINTMAVFGCKTYVYVDADTRAQNVNPAYIGYFVGNTYNMIGYNVYSPSRRGVYEAFHVKFNTQIMYKDEWGPEKRRKKTFRGTLCR